MDSNLDKIALDLYGKIKTRFPDITMGDENAQVLSKKEDIPKARFFEFEYEEDGEPLGTIAITLDSEDGLVMQVSGDLVDDRDRTTHHGAYQFIRGFRQFAKDRLLNFDVQNIGKSNLDKRDYEFQAKRKEEPVMPQQPVMESKMYGNNRMSYQDLGEARLVVKHSQPINLDLPAGRTMHIDSIYIENAQGERFRYPYKHLNGARALAEHIKHGGNPYDAIGKHITGLSEELASLRKFKGYVGRQEQLSEAMAGVTNRVMERIEEIKKEVQYLQRPSYYEEFAESFEAGEEVIIPEEIQNDLIDRLTIRTYNEELTAVFPYIYKFIDETELPTIELGVEDILSDAYNPNSASAENRRNLDKSTHDRLKAAAEKEGASEADKKRYQNYKDKKAAVAAAYDREMERESFDPVSKFENFIEEIVSEDKNEIFSPNKNAQAAAIKKLNDIIGQDIEVGPNGDNAIMTLKGLIDNPEFTELLSQAPAETKLNGLLSGWLNTNHEEILDQVDLNPEGEATNQPEPETEVPPPAPAEPAPAEPAPAEPGAEELPPAPAAPAEQVPPMAESKKKEEDEDPPFDPDPKPAKKTTPGKYGQGYSQAKHLAHQGMADAIKKAKKAGATLETQLDFGYGVKTIQEILDECGMEPADVGFEQPLEGEGLPGMLKFISGFYNKEEHNFPLGGMRVKIKVKKAFEDGMFGNADEGDLVKVIKFIDSKDPSGNEHNQIMRLAGVNNQVSETPADGWDISGLEAQLHDCYPETTMPMAESNELDSFKSLIKKLGV